MNIETLAAIFAAAIPPQKMRHPKKTRFQPSENRLVAECPLTDSFVSVADGVDSEGLPSVQITFVSAPVENEGGTRMKTGFVISREAASTLRILLEQI